MYDSALSYPPVWQLYNYISASECRLRWQQWQASVSSTALSLGSLSEEETESVHTKWLESSLIFINRSITFTWAEHWMLNEHDIVFLRSPWQNDLKNKVHKHCFLKKGLKMLAFITTFVAKKTRIQKLQRLLQLQNKSKETAVNLLDHRVAYMNMKWGI